MLRVEQKPTVASMKLVGTTVYKTQSEAEIALKADKILRAEVEGPAPSFCYEPRWKRRGFFGGLRSGSRDLSQYTGKRSYYLRNGLLVQTTASSHKITSPARLIAVRGMVRLAQVGRGESAPAAVPTSVCRLPIQMSSPPGAVELLSRQCCRRPLCGQFKGTFQNC